MKRPIFLFVIASLLSLTGSLWAESAPVAGGFREIRLGMSLDEVKTQLAKDPYFNYRGDPDVSMLLKPDDNLIECDGVSYISRAYFQFHDKQLYTITLVLDPSQIGFYALYTTLTAKYGDPASLSPEEIVWQSDRYRLSLERPLSVKWIDRQSFDQIKEAGKAQESERSLSRDEFLKEF